MPVRDSMLTDLIPYVRDLINDPTPQGVTPQFTDQQVQDKLDVHRLDVRQRRLMQADTLGDGTNGTEKGVIYWFEFFAQIPFWESDAQIQGPGWDTLTPSESDWLIGRWVFATSQTFPLYITGKHYDVYATAVDLLTMWEAELRKQSWDFTAGGATLSRSQRLKAIRDLKGEYRKRQPLRVIRTRRGDQMPSLGSGR